LSRRALFNFAEQVKALLLSSTGRSISIVTGGNLINMVLGLLVSIYSLRFLTSEQIGIIYPLVSFLLLLNQFSDLGLSMTFLKLGSRYFKPFIELNTALKEDRETLHHNIKYFSNYFWLKVFVGGSISLLCFLLASPLALLIFNSVDNSYYIRIVSLISIFQFLSGYFQSSLQVEKKFSAFMMSRLLPQLIKTVGMISIVALGYLNLKLALLFFFQVPIVSCLIAFFFSEKRYISLRPKTNLSVEFFSTSRWICLSMIANTAMASSDIIMTRSLVGAEELSIYLGGQKLASVLPILSSSLLAVLLPKVTSMNNDDQVQFFIRKALRFLPFFSGAILLCLPFTSFIVNFLLGPKYISSVSVLNAFLVVHAFAFLITPLGTVLYRMDKEKTFAYINLTQLLMNIVLNWILIPRYGAIGAAGTTLATKIIAGVVIYYVLFQNGYILTRFKGKKL
jgi:O-antigen/teichoic acid export membrane protein